MLRNRPQKVFWAVVLGDAIALGVAFAAASFFEPAEVLARLAVAVPGVYVVLACLGRVHVSIRGTTRLDILWRTCVFWVQLVMGIAIAYLIIGQKDPFGLDRSACLTVAVMYLLPLVISRITIPWLFKRAEHGGSGHRYIVIAGTGETARITAEAFEDHPGWGLELLGFLRTRDDPTQDPPREGMKVLGHFSQLTSLVQNMVVDEIVVADPGASLECVEEVVRISETLGLRALIVADFCQTKSTTVERTHLAGRTLLSLTPYPDDLFGGTFKRAIDIVGSAVGMIVLAPVFFLVASAVKLSSKGPAFYAQTRVGRNGRLFTFYKFRTMVVGADSMKNGLMAQNEMDGPVFKMRNDPRVTPIGKFLRKYSIDELPQLWNVFRGDMSLVGPRPPVPEEVAFYEAWQRRRLSMKPGLTCLWQVNGRNHTDFQTWMRQDLDYIDNWSMSRDVKILMKTFPAVFSGRGAS